MSRILILSTFFPPLNSIASLRPYSWAKEWSDMGHHVTVVTTEKTKDPSTDLQLNLENIEIIEVKPLLNLRKQKEKFIQSKGKNRQKLSHRILNKLKYGFGVFNGCRMPDFADLWIYPAYKKIQSKEPWDFVVSTAGPYSVHILAYLLKKKNLTNFWIADYRDPWSNNYIYSGLFPFNIFEKFLEKTLLKKANLISTVSDPFKEYYIKKYKCPVTLVYNGFNFRDLENIDSYSPFPQDDKFRIVHTGSIYLGKRDPTPLFQAIKELQKQLPYQKLLKKLEVLFVGSETANLQELIDLYEVSEHVKMQGFVSRETSLAMQKNAHALLFLPWNDPQVDGILTGKIFEYLHSKTPIIAVGCSHIEASQQLIKDFQGGICLHSVEDIKEHLLHILTENKQVKTQISDTALAKFDRKYIAQDFLNLILKETSKAYDL